MNATTSKNIRKKSIWAILGMLTIVVLMPQATHYIFADVSEQTQYTTTEKKIPYTIDSIPTEEIILPQRETNSVDKIFTKIQGDIPGFAGMFFDEQDKLTVYLKDPNQISSMQVAMHLNNYLKPQDFKNGINILKGKQDWNQWVNWKDTLMELPHGELGVTMLDIDEKNQELDIGLVQYNVTSIQQIDKFLNTNSIPTELVSYVETGELVEESDGVTVSPMKGGAQLGVVDSGYCTSGFVADRASDGVRVVTTAGHCEVNVDSSGDQTFTNPYGGSVMGGELSNTNLPGPRYSDSLLIGPSVSTSLGQLYVDGATRTINGKAYLQLVNDSICKYGATQHQDCGNITHVDVTITDSPSFGTLWNQNIGNYVSAGGDSGGPVYRYDTTTSVTLYGTHVGSWPIGKVFSPIDNIEADQGTLYVN